MVIIEHKRLSSKDGIFFALNEFERGLEGFKESYEDYLLHVFPMVQARFENAKEFRAYAAEKRLGKIRRYAPSRFLPFQR